MDQTPLHLRSFETLAKGAKAMAIPTIESHLHLLGNGWQPSVDYRTLVKTYKFKNYYQSMNFANAVAYMANHLDHHPVMKIRYDSVEVIIFTERLEGLSVNDFIFAARTDRLHAGDAS